MKLHIISDVHLEFQKWPRSADINAIDADVSILAGDIGIGLSGLDWALKFPRPVLYVAGNHEFYSQYPMKEWWEKARAKIAGTHIRLLENEAFTIGDVRFLGATLWTDYDLQGADQRESSMKLAQQDMSDFIQIYQTRRGPIVPENSSWGSGYRHSGDPITPAFLRNRHMESRAFIERNLLDESWAGKTVVITHHAPSIRSVSDNYKNDLISNSYASNLDELVARTNLWIHGHTHDSADYLIGQGRVFSNPRGYGCVEENSAWNPVKVVEL